MNRRSSLSQLVIICALLTSAHSLAATIIVNSDGSGDYPTIQTAIDAAVDGDVVMLQPGTYTGVGNRDIHFNGKAITVRGATNYPEDCVIDCQISGSSRGFNFHGSEKSDSRLESLTITNGYGPTEHIYGTPYDLGGAIYCSYSSPTIHNCIIHNNSAPEYGGGIFLDHSNPVMSNCVIRQNSTAAAGGAIFCFYSSPTITNCIVADNATNYGRGAINCQGGNLTMRNCTIVGNFGIWNECAGIYLSGVNCSIKNCIV